MTDVQITLIKRGTAAESDEFGRAVKADTERTIFAEQCGIKRNEFYQAAAVGMSPSLTFRCWVFEYQNEKALRFGGKEYQVIRTYPVEGERLELICSDIAEG